MKNTQDKKLKKLNKAKTEKLKKKGYIKKGGNGGRRPNSGRKKSAELERVRKIKEQIEKHGLELVEIRRGKKVMKLSRIFVLLEALFAEGSKGNVTAIREYMDRQIGRPSNNIKFGDVDDFDFNFTIKTVKNKDE